VVPDAGFASIAMTAIALKPGSDDVVATAADDTRTGPERGL
jgi:hypothetical protein